MWTVWAVWVRRRATVESVAARKECLGGMHVTNDCLAYLVQDQVNQIKSRHESGRELNVLHNDLFGLYRLSTGLAEARMEVRALRVQMIPALAIDTVCCSITSCRIDRVESDIWQCNRQ